MDIMIHRNISDYQNHKKGVIPRRELVEKFIASQNRDKSEWLFAGFCETCGKATNFLLDWSYSDKKLPNFRERLVCKDCGLNNRQRFMANYLKNIVESNDQLKDIYVYEQVTNFYQYLKEIYKDKNIIGSEYLGFDKNPGETINGLRHEDASNLSFDNESIDVIISNDVYEHVPDIRKAFSEAYRVLKENGKLLFTIPFDDNKKEIRQRATLESGEIVHLQPELYHGNPISEEGSLVFYDFGWDLLDLCKEVGFRDVYVVSYYSFFNGYFGSGIQIMFVAEKRSFKTRVTNALKDAKYHVLSFGR